MDRMIGSLAEKANSVKRAEMMPMAPMELRLSDYSTHAAAPLCLPACCPLPAASMARRPQNGPHTHVSPHRQQPRPSDLSQAKARKGIVRRSCTYVDYRTVTVQYRDSRLHKYGESRLHEYGRILQRTAAIPCIIYNIVYPRGGRARPRAAARGCAWRTPLHKPPSRINGSQTRRIPRCVRAKPASRNVC